MTKKEMTAKSLAKLIAKYGYGDTPSNTEKGHATDLSAGRTVTANGIRFKSGVDLNTTARGGTKTTKRNRIVVGDFFYASTKSGIDMAVRHAIMWG